MFIRKKDLVRTRSLCRLVRLSRTTDRVSERTLVLFQIPFTVRSYKFNGGINLRRRVTTTSLPVTKVDVNNGVKGNVSWLVLRMNGLWNINYYVGTREFSELIRSYAHQSRPGLYAGSRHLFIVYKKSTSIFTWSPTTIAECASLSLLNSYKIKYNV